MTLTKLLIWIIVALAFYSLVAFVTACHLWDRHHGLSNKDCIRAIVGEASNQTIDTMICVAHAIRNRGTLQGVYGFHAKHIETESKQTWRKAAIAWDLSGQEADVVKGAQNFGTIHDKNITARLDFFGRFHGKAKCGDFYFF